MSQETGSAADSKQKSTPYAVSGTQRQQTERESENERGKQRERDREHLA